MSKKEYIVNLDGYIWTRDDSNQVPLEPFLDDFIDWLHSKGLAYTGFSVQTDMDGKPIKEVTEIKPPKRSE
ncbi:hypothetical protein U8V72_15125 [Priestia filamentosa]|uniref:hypothetical protein n=1 Tax=Priestia filamentosa TaxID=1402861 RepID=UPI00058929B6